MGPLRRNPGTAARRRAVRASGDVLRAAQAASGEAIKAAELFRSEPFWQAQAAIVGAVILYLSLPGKYIVGPNWVMPGLELLLVAGLWFDRPRPNRERAQRERTVVLVLLALVALSNALSLELLVHFLLNPHSGAKPPGGHELILSSVVIWLTNVAVFALGYWQLDRGGPDRRAREPEAEPDFLFVQMTEPTLPVGWAPNFVDYLYLSFTNSTALSPTDTMPLTGRAKLLMALQSVVSLVTVLLVASRAVNILR